VEAQTRHRERAADRLARRVVEVRPEVAFAFAALIAAALLLALSGNFAFFNGDEWNMAINRRGHDLDAFLAANNAHIVLVPVVVYKLLQHTFGMGSNIPYHVVAVALQVLVSVLLLLYARRRCQPWVAVLIAVVPLLLGAAWEDLLWAFQMCFATSIAAGLAALLALDRGSTRADVVASLLLVVSCASSDLGLAFATGAAVDVLLRPGRWRRLWIAVVPVVLWGLWYLSWGWGRDDATAISVENVLHAPAFVAGSLSAVLASIFGLVPGGTPPVGPMTWGPALAVAFVLAAWWRVSRGDGMSPRLWALVAIPLVFWSLAAMNAGPARTPEASRYLFPGAVMVLLLSAELLRGVTVPLRIGAIMAVIVCFSIWSNVGALRDGADFMREQSDFARAATAALEISRDRVPLEMTLDASTGTPYLGTVSAGAYFSAVDAFGSPAYDEPRLEQASDAARGGADVVLARAYGLSVDAASTLRARGQRPVVLGSTAASATGHGSCVRVVPRPGVPIDIQLPVGGAGLRFVTGDPTDLRLRRFADTPTVGLDSARTGSPVVLRVPSDRSRKPWVLRATAANPFRVCGLGPV